MVNGPQVPREDESFSVVRNVKRSRLFFTAPIIIIAALSANLIWEIVRGNVAPHDLASWPFRFSAMDEPTTATVLAVFVGIFMGRLQWARTLQPIVRTAIDDEGGSMSPDSKIWRFWIYNAGSAVAQLENISYYVKFADQPEWIGDTNWVPLSVVNDQLRSRGLRDGSDYFVTWLTPGSPFPVVKSYLEGRKLAWFSIEALKTMRILDIRIRYMDSLGDIHEKTTPLMQRLPSVAVTAIINSSKSS